MNKNFTALGFASACLVATLALADPTPRDTKVIGPFVGHDAQFHPDNLEPKRIEFYGTDLGWTYVHAGKLVWVFGDTSADEAGKPIDGGDGQYDDTWGTLEISEWPDPARITSSNIPRLKLYANPGTTEVAGIRPGFPLEQFKTPIGAFSNGSREFGMFYTHKPTACRIDADCGTGFSCDTGLGWRGTRHDDPKLITFACPRGTADCKPDPLLDAKGAAVAGSGFCVDKKSSIAGQTPNGRVWSVRVKNVIGMRSTEDPRVYANTRDWTTNRFANAFLQPVQDFVPERGAGRAQQDYNIPSKPSANQRVFIFGRPGFLGINKVGRTLDLYVAYVDMPRDGNFKWEPNYYAGSDARGTPRFSRNESDAMAVDLDSTKPGVQPTEKIDVVNQQSVVWVEHLKKWVMFYAGGVANVPMPSLEDCGLLQLFVGPECKDVVVGNGAVQMRTADDPWGPWTPPKEVISGGDPGARPVAGLYAPGGVLFHPECKGERCATRTHTPMLPPNDYGFLYAANIIGPWIKPVGKSVDVIWNASTWDPYRVILLRTRIDP